MFVNSFSLSSSQEVLDLLRFLAIDTRGPFSEEVLELFLTIPFLLPLFCPPPEPSILISLPLSFSFSGRLIIKSLGRNCMKTDRTHGAILCVDGDRKLTFRTMMVTQTENVTRIMVKSRYFPRRGTARDVGGMISASNRKNTPKESMIEMLNDTCHDARPEHLPWNAI